MMIFRLRIRRSPLSMSERFNGTAIASKKIDYAIEACDRLKSGTEPAGPVPLLGLYMKLYERRFGFPWMGTTKLVSEELQVFKRLYEMYGNRSFSIVSTLMQHKDLQ